MSTKRIEALTDGVMAIAMTVLVLGLKVPTNQVNSTMLLKALYPLLPRFYNFLIAFFILSSFWIADHRQFNLINYADDTLLWINVSILMFVVLIPFSVSLYSENQSSATAGIIFELNIMVIGLLLYLQWRYASTGHRLIDKKTTRKSISAIRQINLVTPLIAAIAVILSFITPRNSTTVFILIPLVVTLLKRRM